MQSGKRPTIIDVAKAAGVSKSTVSLVLQNSAAVRDETRAQVRAAIVALGYVYNRSAANMRMSNAGLIGLVINDLRNPFFTEFATSLQMALSARGYATVVANTDEDPAVQDQVVGAMIEHGISGLILCPAYGESQVTFDMILRAGIPAMQMLRKVDPRLDQFPFSAPDYLAGSRQATRHLLETGARRVAFVGGLTGRAVTTERQAGYLDLVHAAGTEPLVLTGRPNRAFGRSAAHQLRERHPDVDAVVCFNDLVGLGLLSGCHEIGREVGTQIRIVGFDDIEEASQSWPALSSVRCDVAGIGENAAQTLLHWIEEGHAPPPETRSPVSLSIRASSRRP